MPQAPWFFGRFPLFARIAEPTGKVCFRLEPLIRCIERKRQLRGRRRRSLQGGTNGLVERPLCGQTYRQVFSSAPCATLSGPHFVGGVSTLGASELQMTQETAKDCFATQSIYSLTDLGVFAPRNAQVLAK